MSAGLDDEELVDLVMEQVDSDWRLRERLMAQAIASGGGSLDVRTWKRHIDAVFGDRRYFVPYAEAGGWAHDIFDVLADLDDLVSAGHAAAVVALAEHAHRRSDKAVQYIDDSDGWLTDISGRISELHLRACAMAHADPVELAGRLAELELTSELDTFHRAAVTYVDVLGPEGVAAYRRIVEPKWRAAKKHNDANGHGAFAVTQAMIGVALAGGDPDDLIAIRSGDLRTPDDYLEIAQTLVAAGRQAEALDWSRRGLDAFVDRHWQTPPLREFLASQLRAASDNPAAEALWWEAFERNPSLDGYRKLLAESADVEAFQPQAVDLLRQRLEAGDTHARTRNPLLERAPATTLVEILLYEGRSDNAWSAATSHGCDERTWLTLARARETTHPLDAIPIYERAVDAQIDTKNNGGYRSAVDLLARIRTLATKAGEPKLFGCLLATVTVDHARIAQPHGLDRQEGLELKLMIDLPTEAIGSIARTTQPSPAAGGRHRPERRAFRVARFFYYSASTPSWASATSGSSPGSPSRSRSGPTAARPCRGPWTRRGGPHPLRQRHRGLRRLGPGPGPGRQAGPEALAPPAQRRGQAGQPSHQQDRSGRLRGYWWVADQVEVATDVAFGSRAALEGILPSLFAHAASTFSATDVLRFLGRKLHPSLTKEVTTSARRRPEGWRIKHTMGRNSIKVYDKANVLRIETTINDPSEFRVLRLVEGSDNHRQRCWRPGPCGN